MLTQQEQAGRKDALKWRLDLCSSIGSIATLLYYVSLYMEAAAEEIKNRNSKNENPIVYCKLSGFVFYN
jgi:hypothetical protein